MLCLFTALYGFVQSRHAYEYVDNVLDHWPAAKQKGNNVTLETKKVSQADESPVERANEDENPGNLACRRTITCHWTEGES